MRRAGRSPQAVPELASQRATSCTKTTSPHIFELSHCPDLVTIVVDYRIGVLKIPEENELDTKLSHIPSAKNKDIIQQPSEEEIIKLLPQ